MKIALLMYVCIIIIHMYIGAATHSLRYNNIYSGIPLNGHPSTADTCDITDNSECLDCISIDFTDTFKTPQ